ncbi:RagB/SusD family nutrient uptake outer membrane protein [Zobellia nedashkovskayae]|uniref:RagB/SusD family nutrient uptake outer membrane protein n=1 Tax=Zobellia nedashkovskayae TaxID=2779510 RepID=UPI00188AFB85|nr:RagB/SusD family nutrient uptake outer membrane protein [Zobellia nedashkovskayae]
MKNLFKYTLYGLSLAICLVSCNEDEYLQFQDTNGLNAAVLEATPELQESAVVAIYSPFRSEGMYGRYGNLLYDYVSDELSISISGQPQLSRISEFLLDGTFDAPSGFYKAAYSGIAKANFVIDGSENYTTDPEFYEPLVAEAYFMRGVYYYILATRYGDVPIKIGESTSGFQPLSAQADVLQQAVADLKIGSEGMRTKGEQSIGRATNESAFAMLGKTYLYMKEYDEAYAAFNQVTSYSLVANYIDNFNVAGEFNDESLFEIDFRKGALDGIWGNNVGNNNSMSTLRSADYSGWGNSKPNPVMLEAYEDNDPRFEDTWWITGDTYGTGRTWGVDPDVGDFSGPTNGNITMKKYSSYIEDDIHTQDNGTNLRLLRYADVLLMKAETELYRSGGSLSGAIALMNQVRSRPSVNMPLYGSADMDAAGYPVSSVDQAFEALIHERQIELAGEGKRFLDLQRWGLDVEYLFITGIKPNYTLERKFLPIPTEQIDTNPLID